MERPDEHNLAEALASMRAAPRPEFVAELDERLAAGFPRRSSGRAPLQALASRLRSLSPPRIALAAGTTAFAAIAIVTVLVASNDSAPRSVAMEHLDSMNSHRARGTEKSLDRFDERLESGVAPKHGDSSGIQYSDAPPTGIGKPELQGFSAAGAPSLKSLNPTHRDVERSAQIGLLAAPADVAADSAKVFRAVHDADGIVLRSTTSQGAAGRAGAHFDLLIPSRKLSDALAALSAIDEVRFRREATDDITAPTVSVDERAQDSEARIEALLSQLSAAQTESKAQAIEAELRSERQHAARLRSQLTDLNRRADYSRVSLRIETSSSAGAPSSGSSWGVDDAFGDAGHILGVAAGVTVVGLAILTPIALLCLLAWLAHRAWTRGARNRALG